MQLTADRTLFALGAIVVAHEAFCPHGELLSDGCDRHRTNHPVLVRAFVIATAAHLLRLAPARLDIYSYVPMLTVHVLPRYRKDRREHASLPARP
ncbi:DUF7427 family protein [Rhodococcus koreensis]